MSETMDTYVDTYEVYEHVAALLDAGIGTSAIARRAGISRVTVYNLLAPEQHPRTRRATAEAVRRVSATYDYPHDVPLSHTQARVRALYAAGWTRTVLAARIHVTPATITRWATGSHATSINRTLAVRVLDTYRWAAFRVPAQHGCDPTESRNIRLRAERRGWSGPMSDDNAALLRPEHALHVRDTRAARRDRFPLAPTG